MNLQEIKQKFGKKRYIAALIVVLLLCGWGYKQYKAKKNLL